MRKVYTVCSLRALHRHCSTMETERLLSECLYTRLRRLYRVNGIPHGNVDLILSKHHGYGQGFGSG